MLLSIALATRDRASRCFFSYHMPSRLPSATFWGLLLAGSGGLCATYVAVLLGQAHYADVLALGRIPYHEWGYRLAPMRVLLYKGLFSALLLGLVADAWLAKRPAHWFAALGVALLGLGSYHTAVLLREAQRTRPLVATYAASLRWLLRQPPGPVLVYPHPTALYWLVLGHRYAAERPLQLATTPRPGVQYRYVVVGTGSAAITQLARQRQLVYRDAVQRIYAAR